MNVIVVGLIFDYFAAQLFELVYVIRPCVCSAIDVTVSATGICNECYIGVHLD